jgi:hypothetical protein
MDTAAPGKPPFFVVAVTGLIPLAFLAAGAFLSIRGWPAVIEGLGMRDWPEAPGVGTWAMAIGGLPLLALGSAMAIGFVRSLRRR